VLKQNAELEKQNRELKKQKLYAEREAEAMIEGVRRDYEVKEKELNNRMSNLDAEVRRKVEEKTRQEVNAINKKIREIEQKNNEREENYQKRKKSLFKGYLTAVGVTFLFLLVLISAIKKSEIRTKDGYITQYRSNEYYICVNTCEIELEDGTMTYCQNGTNVILLENDMEKVKVISERQHVGYVNRDEWTGSFKKYSPFLLPEK
jgi:hypothetical protein